MQNYIKRKEYQINALEWQLINAKSRLRKAQGKPLLLGGLNEIR